MTEAAVRLQKRIALELGLGRKTAGKGWDPELMYVECMHCGRPILWEPGRTTALLEESGVLPEQLDESCMILSKGCTACSKDKKIFETKVVRLTRKNAPKPEVRDAYDWF